MSFVRDSIVAWWRNVHPRWPGIYSLTIRGYGINKTFRLLAEFMLN